MKLIKSDQIKNLDLKTIEKIYIENINPGQVYYYKLLNYQKTLIKRAKGVYYYDQNDEKILDFSGGVGSLGLGHNHRGIIKVREQFRENNNHQIGPYFFSQYVAALS